MGCACLNPNSQTPPTFVSFDIKDTDKVEDTKEINTTKSAVVIQSTYRKRLTEKKLTEEHQSILDKFKDFISNSKSTTFVSEETFVNRISSQIIQAKEALKGKVNEYNLEINSSRSNGKLHMINVTEITPIEYNEGYQAIYKGGYKFNEKLSSFYRFGKGEYIDKDGDLCVTKWDKDCIESKGIIYYGNGNCYIGEIFQERQGKILPNGKGILYYRSNGYEDYRQGLWDKGKETQHFILHIKDKYTTESTDNFQVIKIKYPNNNIYEGEYLYTNDTYIANGKGTLFIPVAHSNNNTTEGQYFTSNWVNGLQSGPGKIEIKGSENNANIDCLFRFGKVIQSTRKMVKHPVSLHKNIFSFLSINENSSLVYILKTKAMHSYLTDNYSLNLNKIKIHRITTSDNNRYTYYKHLSKDTFLNTSNDIINLDSVFLNYSSGHSQFIPIVGYKTNGGMVEARFKYNNLFNPSIEQFYTTNYIMHLDKDIQIDGVLNRNILEAVQVKDQNNQHQQHAYLRKRSSISNRDHYLIQEDLINQSKKYIELYKQLEPMYSIEKYKIEIKDEQILSKHIGDISKVLFSIHEIVIQIPKQVDHYSYLTNPVRHIAIHISDTKDKDNQINKENDNDIDNIITEEILSKHGYDIKKVLDSKQITPMSYTDNDIFTLVEFDSMLKDSLTSNDKLKLICLIEIKKYTYNPIYLCLKRYYHFGKYISVKLINQSTLFNAKKTCIDMGTISFFGQIYYLK